MVSIGRALMANPTLLIMDEPSLGLAPRMVAELVRFEPDCPLPELVKSVPHVAFILENGAPIELMQIKAVNEK